jgi:hypothetical protein
LPLLRGSLLTAALLVFVDVMKELPATLVMRPFNFDTLATQTFTLGGRRASGRGVERCAGDRCRWPVADHPAGPADLSRTQPSQFLLKGFVGAVTKHTIGTLLAATEINRLAVVGREFGRDEFRAFVAAVAKGLGLALAARAPVVVLAFFDIGGEWGLCCDFGFRHEALHG